MTVNRVALVVLRLRPSGDLVFQRRDHRTDLFPGLLTFFGGVIELGESPIQAALRELNEETSVGLAGTEHLDALGVVGMELDEPVGMLAIHLFEASIYSAEITVYEGAGAEVYSRTAALRRHDVAEHARTLLATLVG